MSIITLTTDFGLADGYVGTMKGVIPGIAPAAAHLARGVLLAELGDPLTEIVAFSLPRSNGTIVGSSDRLEIAVSGGSASQTLEAKVGDEVLLKEEDSETRFLANDLATLYHMET